MCVQPSVRATRNRYFSAVILAMPISFIVVWYKMLFTNDITVGAPSPPALGPWPRLPAPCFVAQPEMRRFPHYKFAIMAFFDTSFNVFSTFPVQHLGYVWKAGAPALRHAEPGPLLVPHRGDLSNVLSQTILPINMVGSFFFLGARFKAVHYLGAFLVIYGILVKLSPDMGTPAFGGSLGWIALAILSNLPSAASNGETDVRASCDAVRWLTTCAAPWLV